MAASWYFTGKPCKQGHISERYVSGRNCVACHEMYQKSNKSKVNKTNQEWQHRNREQVKKTKREYYLKNKDILVARAIAYQRTHPDKTNCKSANYRNRKEQRTPPWLTTEHYIQIQQFYSEASARTKRTQVKHQVDHIYPLKGTNSCGLHVPWNLQVITAQENQRKFNALPFDMID